MNAVIKLAAVFCLLGSLLSCTNSDSDRLRIENEQRQKFIVDLQNNLETTKASLSEQKAENEQLKSELSAAMAKMRDGQTTNQPTQPINGAKAKSDDPSRIEILGAKAVAEFKADLLAKRLENAQKNINELKSQLSAKDNEVKNLAGQIGERDQEISRIKNLAEQEFAVKDNRVSELQSKLDQLTKENAGTLEKLEKLTAEAGENKDLAATFKSALSDATRIKTAAESEIGRLQGEVKNLTATLETTKTELNEVSGDFESCKSGYEQLSSQAEKFRSHAAQLTTENERIKTEMASMSERMKSMEAASAPGDNGRSNIDKLLDPGHGGQADTKPLY